MPSKRKSVIRDSSGRFARKDNRKNQYQTFVGGGKRTINKKIGRWSTAKKVIEQIVPVAPKVKLPITARPAAKYLDVITLTDRVDDVDFYKYLTTKNINQRVKALIKKMPKTHSAVARVKMRIGKRTIITSEFLLRESKDLVFIGGKRKGRKLSYKDIIAYYVHRELNNQNYTLYKYTTDTAELVKGKRYAKQQTFEISIRHVSPKAVKAIDRIKAFESEKS